MSAISAMASASLFDKLHAQSSQTDELADFHQGLTNRYPRVPHLSTEDLAALSPSQVKLFDVRKQVEYDVSHLNAAIRISPGMRASAFLDKYQHQLPGKKVVFYCSVGERSSKLAQAVIDRLGNSDLDIFNLEGGIFKWHNEGRVVFNTNGPTDKIHPFNKFWGRLLARRDQISQN
jgi:rhodanese-related sulfurtransferase